MEIIWRSTAFDGLERIRRYIATEDPVAAERVFRDILSVVDHLAAAPALGRAGRVEGTRELVVPRTGYLVAYAVVGGDQLVIVAVQHAAQDWPERF